MSSKPSDAKATKHISLFNLFNDPSGVPQTRILLTCCVGVSYFDGILVINGLRKSILSFWGAWPCIWAKIVSGFQFWAFWGPGCGHGQKWPQEFHSKHFERLAVAMGKNSLWNSILTILDAWPWIWAKVVSGTPFWQFWWPGCGYGQKWIQNDHFRQFGGEAVDIGKSCWGSIFLTI